MTNHRILLGLAVLVSTLLPMHAAAADNGPRSLSGPGDRARELLIRHYGILEMQLGELREFLKREGFASRFVVPEAVHEEDLNLGMNPEKLRPLDKLLALDPTLPAADPSSWILIFHDGQDVIDVAVGSGARPRRTAVGAL